MYVSQFLNISYFMHVYMLYKVVVFSHTVVCMIVWMIIEACH